MTLPAVLSHHSSASCAQSLSTAAVKVPSVLFHHFYGFCARPLSISALTAAAAVLCHHFSNSCDQPFFDDVVAADVVWPHNPFVSGCFPSAVYS